MKRICVVTPTYNEEGNVLELYRRTKAVFASLNGYLYEHLFIDNASTDRTVEVLKEMARHDLNVKIIVNSRNFGHIRSPHHGLLQSDADATILLMADLQDPPEVLRDFVRKWEEGFKLVLGVKSHSEESRLLFFIRKRYYQLVTRLSGMTLVRDFNGFGLYDRQIIDLLRTIHDPYPYMRGLVAEVGFDRALVTYRQAQRKHGKTKNNFYTLYDMAMLGITNHSKVPLRIATMLGFALSCVSVLVAFGYLVAKLLFWNIFSAGIAPLVIGGFTFLSVQLFFIGLLGEYLAAVHAQVLDRPLVIERERVNFTTESSAKNMTASRHSDV